MTVRVGSVLTQDEYKTMSDDELASAMSGCSSSLIDIAKKIKNSSWGNREKEFRVHTYEPYSNPEHWAEILNTKIYSWLSNPTGCKFVPCFTSTNAQWIILHSGMNCL